MDEKYRQIPIQRKLNRILFDYRNTPSTSTNKTPSSSVFCYVPRTLVNSSNPVKLSIENEQKQSVKPSSASHKSSYSPPVKTYNRGDKVLYRNHLDEFARWIPAIILEKISPLTYLINLEGNVRMVHANQIRISDLSDMFHPTLPVICSKPRSESPEPPTRESEFSSPSGIQQAPAEKQKSVKKKQQSDSAAPTLRRSKRIKSKTKKALG